MHEVVAVVVVNDGLRLHHHAIAVVVIVVYHGLLVISHRVGHYLRDSRLDLDLLR